MIARLGEYLQYHSLDLLIEQSRQYHSPATSPPAITHVIGPVIRLWMRASKLSTSAIWQLESISLLYLLMLDQLFQLEYCDGA